MHVIPELELGKNGIKEPKKSNLARNTRRQRAKVEEELGERWSKIEEKLYGMILEGMSKRHSLIRSSPQCMAVAEMILAREPLKNIESFLRERDPYHFSPKKISTSALRQQIVRFGQEVLRVLEESDDGTPFNLLDFYARMNGKHVQPIAMMQKLLLLQEHRLCNALLEEDKQIHALQHLDPNSGEYRRGLSKAMRSASKELMLYWKILMSYAAYEMLQEPDQGVQQWMRHDISADFRACMPFTVRRYRV